MSNWLQILISVLTGSALTTGIFGYFLTHPEKFEKWLSMLAWLVSRVYKNAEYVAIKAQIQGEVNHFIGELERKSATKFPKIRLEWTARGEEEIVWEEGKAIMVMRDKQHKQKNIVHAVYFFTSEALLRRSKRHLSKSQKVSLNLFATLAILRAESKAAVEQFMDGYLTPTAEKNEAIRAFIEQYLTIDRLGVFFPILIQELTYLGNKVFLSKPTQGVIDEVKELVIFLENFANREVGNMRIPDSFLGKYTRCSIKIVSSKEQRERGNISIHRDRINDAVRRNLENIYVIGGAEAANKKFMENVLHVILNEHPQLEIAKTETFRGEIFNRNKKLTKVETHLIQIRNPQAVRYLYQDRDLD